MKIYWCLQQKQQYVKNQQSDQAAWIAYQVLRLEYKMIEQEFDRKLTSNEDNILELIEQEKDTTKFELECYIYAAY